MIEMRKHRSGGHFIFDTCRGAIRFGFGTKLVEVMREQQLFLASLIKCDAKTEREHAAKNPKNSIHAKILCVKEQFFKLEALPC